MPFVDDPHYCKPPIWPWMYRQNTVWECPKCHKKWRVAYDWTDKEWKET